MIRATFMFSTSTKKDISFIGLSALLSLTLSACNGGGGGGSASTNGEAPTFSLSSPTYSSATTSSVFSVTGTASDADSSISTLTVNGVAANSNDNFATWAALLPIDSSIEGLDIRAEDTEGNVTEQSYNIRLNKLSSIFSEPTELTLDERNNQLIITDKSQGKLYRSALSNPSLSSLALSTNGDQIELSAPAKTILDKNTNAALLIDTALTSRSSTSAVYSINTDSGVTSNKIGLASIEGLSKVIDIASSPNGQQLYILSELENSRSGGAIISYNVASGSASTLTLTETHSDPDATSPSSLAISNNGAMLYYLDNDALVSVNVTTSEINTVSDRNSAITLGNPKDLIINSSLNKAWIADTMLSAVIEIDMRTGARRVVSSSSIGQGPVLKAPDKLIFEHANNRLLVADQYFGLIFSVEVDTGNREYYISNRFGYGPSLEAPSDIVVDPNRNTAYVSDNTAKGIFSINLSNGNRELLSSNDPTNNQGDSFHEIAQLAIDASSQTLWATDKGQGNIIEVSINDGQRSKLSPSYTTGSEVIQKPTGIVYNEQTHALLASDIFNDSVQALALDSQVVTMQGSKILSNGNIIDKPVSLALDTSSNKIYAIDALLKAVIEWDPATNSAKALSKLFTGQGVNFSSPNDIQIDANEAKAYVSDSALNAIISVDLSSGDREIITSNSIGTGPKFQSVAGIALNTTNNSLIVADPKGKSILSVNLADGSRRIISR